MPYWSSTSNEEIGVRRETPTIIDIQKGFDRPELVTRDLTFQGFRARIDPFIVVSLFDMRGPVFPPHPHAGFSVATYIFPESEIGFWNQDTLGNVNQIPPGALHVTVAGAGVMYEETVTRSGRSATGLQIWMDHAAADREVAPRGIHLAAGNVPTISAGGVTRRVLIGTSGGVVSPVDAPVSAKLTDADLAAGAIFREQVPEGETGFAIVRSGRVETPDGAAGPGSAVFASDGVLELTAREAARLTFFGGRPMEHAFHPAGAFVASDETQAKAFRARYGAGGMGRLTPFDQAALDRDFDAAGAVSG